jgi:hypothetical protein
MLGSRPTSSYFSMALGRQDASHDPKTTALPQKSAIPAHRILILRATRDFPTVPTQLQRETFTPIVCQERPENSSL